MDKSQVRFISRLTAISMAVFLFSTNAEAARPGLYLGVQGGWADIHDTGITRDDMNELITDALGNGNFTITSFSGKQTQNGAGWRIFGGYQIGYNWAAEIGWAVYPDMSTRPTAAGVDNNTGNAYTVGTTGTYKTAVFDFVGKYIYPFGGCICSPMNVYAKLGLAIATGWATPTITLTEPTLTAQASKNNDKSTSLFPTFGVGFGYDFRPDITGDISYNRVQQVGGSGAQGSIDFVSAGLIFHFN